MKEEESPHKYSGHRLVTAFQTADKFSVATPVNWIPGNRVVVPPPKKVDEVRETESHKGKIISIRIFISV